MGLYFAYASDISLRKVSSIFCFKNHQCLLRENNRFLLIDGIDSIEDIVRYAANKKIDSYEILLDKKPHLKDILSFLTNYLLDKDISIGLLTNDSGLINKRRKTLDFFGVNYPKEIEPISYASASINYDEVEANGMPKLKRCRMAPKPSPKIELDESFHDKLMRLLVDSNKDNVEIYKKAGITRQVFSKIISNKDMIPTKLTVVSLCIGLELPLDIAKELVVSAGYSLSKSFLFDSIVMKYLKDEIYDLDEINLELNEYGCQLLGWHPRDN